jgi:hypothetical protein
MPNGKSGVGSWFWCAVSGAVGVAVEIIISHAGQRREAWDSPYYWTFGVPALILGALVSGFFARRNRLAIGYAPFLGQLIKAVAFPDDAESQGRFDLVDAELESHGSTFPP